MPHCHYHHHRRHHTVATSTTTATAATTTATDLELVLLGDRPRLLAVTKLGKVERHRGQQLALVVRCVRAFTVRDKEGGVPY